MSTTHSSKKNLLFTIPIAYALGVDETMNTRKRLGSWAREELTFYPGCRKSTKHIYCDLLVRITVVSPLTTDTRNRFRLYRLTRVLPYFSNS